MQYSAREDEPDEQLAALGAQLKALVRGLGMELVDLCFFRTKGRKGRAMQVRAVVHKPGALGTGDCSKVHRAIVPRLELEFPDREFSVEVSTPGINRVVRDGVELAHYRGRGVRLWRTDISDWSAGLLEAADEQGITITGKEGEIRLDYAVVAKARLDPSQEEYIGH